MDRIEGHIARGNELMAELRDEFRLMRKENLREHQLNRAAIQNLQEVNRQMLLELRDHRPILERIDQGVQSTTQGLMHVLDELRNGRGGAGRAGAT